MPFLMLVGLTDLYVRIVVIVMDTGLIPGASFNAPCAGGKLQSPPEQRFIELEYR